MSIKSAATSREIRREFARVPVTAGHALRVIPVIRSRPQPLPRQPPVLINEASVWPQKNIIIQTTTLKLAFFSGRRNNYETRLRQLMDASWSLDDVFVTALGIALSQIALMG